MKDIGIMIIGIVFLIGLCTIAGFLSRNTDSREDRDSIGITILRGLAILIGLSMPLSVIIGILYLIFSK
ncbi:MAG: hypothetical protein K6E73_04990 [Bacteroidales bacterium]|nr:hypothetical protein [Bacteroidales bacterium]